MAMYFGFGQPEQTLFTYLYENGQFTPVAWSNPRVYKTEILTA